MFVAELPVFSHKKQPLAASPVWGLREPTGSLFPTLQRPGAGGRIHRRRAQKLRRLSGNFICNNSSCGRSMVNTQLIFWILGIYLKINYLYYINILMNISDFFCIWDFFRSNFLWLCNRNAERNHDQGFTFHFWVDFPRWKMMILCFIF